MNANLYAGAGLCPQGNGSRSHGRKTGGNKNYERFLYIYMKKIKSKINFLQKMIRAADRDGSGSVEFNEFMNMMCKNIEVSKRKLYPFH